jgi:hypothetical protein
MSTKTHKFSGGKSGIKTDRRTIVALCSSVAIEKLSSASFSRNLQKPEKTHAENRLRHRTKKRM